LELLAYPAIYELWKRNTVADRAALAVPEVPEDKLRPLGLVLSAMRDERSMHAQMAAKSTFES
jgi:hypothetical protein